MAVLRKESKVAAMSARFIGELKAKHDQTK